MKLKNQVWKITCGEKNSRISIPGLFNRQETIHLEKGLRMYLQKDCDKNTKEGDTRLSNAWSDISRLPNKTDD